MKRKILIIFGIFASFIIINTSCSKLDNYAAPSGSINGQLVDSTDKSPFQTEQPNGAMVTLWQDSATVPYTFWTRPDGTFTNDLVFNDSYRVIVNQGAFFPVDTARLVVNGTANISFSVMPYLRINANITPLQGGKVAFSYEISRPRFSYKINTAKVLVSSSPSVSNSINEFSASHDLSSIDDNVALATKYTDTLTGLTSGMTYYARVGARVANPSSRYNYCPIVKVTMP